MSNLKLEDGFYWADSESLGGRGEVVEALGSFIYVTGYDVDTNVDDFDFGPNPKPIPKPEWCK